MDRERGFIFVEIVTILLIIGMLITLWIPNYIAIKKKAQAATVIGDYLLIRDAVTMYYSDYDRWPQSSRWGESPEGLALFLPSGFSWDRRPEVDIRYSWEYLPVPGLDGAHAREITGLSVFSSDDALLRAIAGIFRGRMVLAKGFDDTRRIILIVQTPGRTRDG